MLEVQQQLNKQLIIENLIHDGKNRFAVGRRGRPQGQKKCLFPKTIRKHLQNCPKFTISSPSPLPFCGGHTGIIPNNIIQFGADNSIKQYLSIKPQARRLYWRICGIYLEIGIGIGADADFHQNFKGQILKGKSINPFILFLTEFSLSLQKLSWDF